jgi:hypothetical protein
LHFILTKNKNRKIFNLLRKSLSILEEKMNKILFVGIVVLMVLVCLPVAVSAAEADTVVVNGSIGGSLDVDVLPNTGVNWGTMAIGTRTDLTNVTLNVTTTYPAWHVNAADLKGGANTGYMVDSVAGNLTNPFELSNNNGLGWTSMTTQFTNFQSFGPTGGAGSRNFPVGLRQVIAITDEAALNYQITITFTGSAG